jgi:hypothetical protein
VDGWSPTNPGARRRHSDGTTHRGLWASVGRNREKAARGKEREPEIRTLRSALCGKGRKTPPQSPCGAASAPKSGVAAPSGARTAAATADFGGCGAVFGEHCVGNTNLLEKAPPVTASNSTRLSACHTRPASRSAVAAAEGCAGRAGVGERGACASLSTLARRAAAMPAPIDLQRGCWQHLLPVGCRGEPFASIFHLPSPPPSACVFVASMHALCVRR